MGVYIAKQKIKNMENEEARLKREYARSLVAGLVSGVTVALMHDLVTGYIAFWVAIPSYF
jgi:hypothetical protein